MSSDSANAIRQITGPLGIDIDHPRESAFVRYDDVNFDLYVYAQGPWDEISAPWRSTTI